MKRTFLAPLLSAFILPGLGQVVNGQVRKAGLLIAAASLLFLTLFIKIIYDLNKVYWTVALQSPSGETPSLAAVAQRLSGQDKTALFTLLFLLLGLWVYGVWDAFWSARRLEDQQGKCDNT